MKTFTAFAAALLLVALPLATVDAARFEAGEIVTVSQEEFVPQNAYIAGGQVTFSSTAQKDLILVGGKVLNTGVVWGDLAAAGGTVDVVEDVRGDVRVAGGQVTVQGVIGGDVIVAGGAVTILPGTTIAGDLVVAGGAVRVEGVVSGATRLYGGDIFVNNTLAGPVTIFAQEKVTFGEKAIIGSTLSYRAPEEATIEEGAKLGEQVTYEPVELPQVDAGTIAAVVLGIMTAVFIAKLIALAVTSAVVASLFTNVSRSVATEAVTRFWQSALVGFGVLFLTPAVAVALIVTVIGMYLGFMLFALYALVLLLGSVYLCIVAGVMASKVAKQGVQVDWKWAVLGTVLVFAVWLIPVVGWIVTMLIYLAAVGAVSSHAYHALKARLS